MVVYSVLTTESDTQYVRVYTSYNPPGNDPSKNQDEQSVTDATVTVSSESALYHFEKTVVQRPDTSRYPSSIIAYVSYPFRPSRGKTYTLTISSSSLGTATAVSTVPGSAQISLTNFSVLADPYHTTLENYGMDIYFSGQTKAFVARIYVDYLAATMYNGIFQPKRREIPIAVKLLIKYMGTYELIYPAVRRTSPTYRESESFPTQGWYDLLENIILLQDGLGSRFVQAVFQVVHFDEPLYNAYGVSSNFQDRYSVRLDESDYTNISGGTGVFGSVAVDSVVSVLPYDIYASRPHGR
jgi:hypothetical protein